MTTAQVPEILHPVRGKCEVRFSYTFANGETARITGHFERFCGSAAAGITGIKVRLDRPATLARQPAVAKAIEADPRYVLVSFALARITPGESGTIVPVSKKERAAGTGAAAYARATDKQVAYALSLCGRTCPGGGNFYRPAEPEFRAMSKTRISEWIDMARDELGVWV